MIPQGAGGVLPSAARASVSDTRREEAKPMRTDTIRAAAIQIAPDLSGRAGTVERVLNAIAEAAGKGARFIVFPETFVPYYP